MVSALAHAVPSGCVSRTDADPVAVPRAMGAAPAEAGTLT